VGSTQHVLLEKVTTLSVVRCTGTRHRPCAATCVRRADAVRLGSTMGKEPPHFLSGFGTGLSGITAK
jgi:hypothetical protein